MSVVPTRGMWIPRGLLLAVGFPWRLLCFFACEYTPAVAATILALLILDAHPVCGQYGSNNRCFRNKQCLCGGKIKLKMMNCVAVTTSHMWFFQVIKRVLIPFSKCQRKTSEPMCRKSHPVSPFSTGLLQTHTHARRLSCIIV